MSIFQKCNSKIKTREEIVKLLERRLDYKIGFTSGAFDLIHYQHTQYLNQAKDQCDILIVGLNSDTSVQKSKGLSRPILKEEERIRVIAALASVDYVFLFDEKNNNKNIELLKPNFYFKGDDYIGKKLSSQALVEAQGGAVAFISTDTSIEVTGTSSIIQKIKGETIECSKDHIYDGIALIDRDGVINKEVNYLSKVEDFEFIDGAIEGIKALNQANIAVVVITNQPGIGVGLYSKEDFFNINRKMINKLHKEEAWVDKVLFCPDMRKDSYYKKPNEGMLLKAVLGLKTKGKIFMIGDRRSDALAAHKADLEIETIGVKTGKGLADRWVNYAPSVTVKNLLEATEYVKENIDNA
ncbi:MAG: hypothetical protein DRH90_13100 [Deltaproteobacteria bacterium]|nr:MAG: hypothetical protein DRH90_13100 [Deltaproteobacteria bacterium]